MTLESLIKINEISFRLTLFSVMFMPKSTDDLTLETEQNEHKKVFE